MATKHTNTCLQKAGDDEDIFVLRAQDALASEVILYWASVAEGHGVPQEKVDGARKLAYKMDKWPNKKLPD